MKEYTVIINRNDLKGDRMDGRDCPGHRAFKRALPWWKRLFTNTDWLTYYGGLNESWGAYDEDGNSVNMWWAKVGDVVTFRKIK